jgi:hypothetical protein
MAKHRLAQCSGGAIEDFVLPNALPILAARDESVRSSCRETMVAPLAQLVEQVTLNHWVAGSIPARCTPSPNGPRR